MHIQVNGKQIDIGNSLSNHVENNLAAAVSKYFDRPADAVVTFSKDGHGFRCDATVHLATGLTAQSSATANEIYAAFDQSADRIEKQVRRYKRRLKDHHRKRERPVDATAAPAYVLDTQTTADEEPETLQPVIVAEMTHPVQVLSVGEAVMQMEFADKAFLIFRHDKTGRVNVVYRRDDDNVGWVDPADTPTT
ncbi:MAG: ribosome-associated translation inhibitor RaiA [Pseudomonadota bacterium]